MSQLNKPPVIQFVGAAKTVTGSKTLLKVFDKKILIDCGLFQGPRAIRERNWDEFKGASEIDAVLLTHKKGTDTLLGRDVSQKCVRTKIHYLRIRQPKRSKREACRYLDDPKPGGRKRETIRVFIGPIQPSKTKTHR